MVCAAGYLIAYEHVWIIEHVKIQEIFGWPIVATVQSTLSPSFCSRPLPVDGPIHAPRNRIVGPKAPRMLSLRSDVVRRRSDLAKMCWSCATKHHISPTSAPSLRSRLSRLKHSTPRAYFSSHSRVLHRPLSTARRPTDYRVATASSTYRPCTQLRPARIRSCGPISRSIRKLRRPSEWRYTRTAAQMA